VDIHEAGAGDEAAGVDFSGALPAGGTEGIDEEAVAHKKVAGGVAFGGGVDDAGVGYPNRGHVKNPKSQRPNPKESLKRKKN
jgi:hypothetical protein